MRSRKKSDIIFTLEPILIDKNALDYTLTPVKSKEESPRLKKITEEWCVFWSKKYDCEHPWWTNVEKQIGEKIRKEGKFGKETLNLIVHWKFLTLPGREKRVKNLLEVHSEEDVLRISSSTFSIPRFEDRKRVQNLRKLNGIGVALASTILTFYDPTNYCVFDMHVMRETYESFPKHIFTTPKYYLNLLWDLRQVSKRVHLPVRTVEKALFMKNMIHG